MESLPLLKTFLTVFFTVFLAEVGDKTQLATMLYASDNVTNRWIVFGGSALALVFAAGIAVLAGGWIGTLASPATIKLVAGLAFVAVGIWTIFG
jgi:putative Ca2+/H+ antiporter (TMEM165/GDT1 family)